MPERSESILTRIAASTRRRVEESRKARPLALLQAQTETLDPASDFPFENALHEGGMSFICEVKKASPSKGLIAKEFPYLSIAQNYERAGAAAISVLTEPEFFCGSDSYLQEIADVVSIPVLRKDFVVDVYQIYEARLLGAAAVLLIVALLDDATLREHIACAHNLGLSALVEVHDKEELTRALDAGARIIGVNNRDLHSFEVDLTTSLRLRPLAPEAVLFVAESGIRTRADVCLLEDAGVDALLIGETLMRAPDQAQALAELKGER